MKRKTQTFISFNRKGKAVFNGVGAAASKKLGVGQSGGGAHSNKGGRTNTSATTSYYTDLPVPTGSEKEYQIEDVKVRFPFPAYGCQLNIMENVFSHSQH